MQTTFVTLAASLLLGACASAPATLDTARVVDPSDASADALATYVGPSGLVAVVFFSARCPCQKAHDTRLVALAERWAPRGVPLVAVASEADVTAEVALRERAARGYPFPLLLDPEGRLAAAVGATFATHAAIVDGAGRVRFSGAIDSDAVALHDDATLYLEDALAALTSGQAVAASGRPKGCVLRKP